MGVETFVEKLTVIDQWSSLAEDFRIIDLGAGTRQLQHKDKGASENEWRPESAPYITGVLCNRIEKLSRMLSAGMEDSHARY